MAILNGLLVEIDSNLLGLLEGGKNASQASPLLEILILFT